MNKSPIVKGAVISYVSIFLNIAISFFYTPWMIRQIGVSDYGLYSLVISFISYFIMDFGLSKAISRFISKYRAEGNEEGVANMIGITTRVYLLIDTIIFVVLFILFFFITNIFKGLTPQETEKLKVLYCIAGSFSVLNFMFKPMDGAMMAFEYFVENKLLDMVQKVGTVLLICMALVFGVGVYALVLINGAVALIVSVSKFLVFKYKSKLIIHWRYFDRKELKDIFSFSVWAFGRGMAQRLRFSLVPTVLGVFCNSTEISFFALGMTLEGMVYTIANAINGLFLPKVSRLSHSNDRDAIMDLMIRVGRIELYIITLIYTGFIIFGQAFLQLWVGAEFSKVYYILIFLITANLVTLTEDIAENLVFVENQIRYTTSIILACSLAGLIGSCLCSSRFGAVGCAFCSGAALCLDVLIVNVFYYKKMQLDIPRFFKECHLKILPVLVILAGLAFVVKDYAQLNSWLKLVLNALLYCVVFVIVAYVAVFNKEEKQLVKSIIKHK